VAAALADGRLQQEGPIGVSPPGGRLTVTPMRDRYVLAGPAEYVFEGSFA